MMNRPTKVREARVHTHNPTTEATHAQRLITQARAWQSHAAVHSRMREATLASKALDSVAFSLECRARSLAVPTKLSGVSQHQDALRQLADLSPMKGHRLTCTEQDDTLEVQFCDLRLGQIQDKHVPWLKPLLPHGASLHFLQVTGQGREDATPGCNVAIARVAEALDRYARISGDGVDVPAPLVLEDVFLWRDRMGGAHASLPVETNWSHSGPNWGYVGAGPTDLSLAVLKRYTDAATAERLCAAFRDDVVASVRFEGAVLRGAATVAWLHRHGA